MVLDSEMRKINSSEELTLDQLKAIVKSGKYRTKLFSFPRLTLKIYRFDRLLFPFATALLCRLFSRGTCRFQEESGKEITVSWGHLFQGGIRWF